MHRSDFSNPISNVARLPDMDERLWRRNCSPFWWRYWAGYRWKRLEYRYDDSPLSHYRTDQQHALALLAEQFDRDRAILGDAKEGPNLTATQVRARQGSGRRPRI